MIDHLIITEKSHLSFADLGIMAELKASDTWRLIEKEELAMRKVKEEVEKKEVEKKAKMEVAKKLKEMGLDNEQIKQSTGLAASVIKKL